MTYSIHYGVIGHGRNQRMSSDSIAIEVHGNGDPVVMVHGLGGTSNVWGPQADVLSRYYRVIRLDLPGSGRSPASGPLSINTLVEAVTAVMERNGATNAHLIGHSMGTIVCQHLAVQKPELVRSLALIGPLAAPPEAARPNIRGRAAKARAEGMTGIAGDIVQAGTSAATKASRPSAAAFVRELLMRQVAEDYARTCEALADAQAAPVEQLRCKALLIVGSEDNSSPPPSVRTLAARIPGAQVKLIDGCGHWATVECPSQVNEALLDFYFSAKATCGGAN